MDKDPMPPWEFLNNRSPNKEDKMAKKPPKTFTRFIYRDSGTGKIISKEKAEKKNPATWEKEKIRVKKPAKGPSKKKGPGIGPFKK